MNANLEVNHDFDDISETETSTFTKKGIKLKVISTSKSKEKLDFDNKQNIISRNFDIFHDFEDLNATFLLNFFNNIIEDSLINLTPLYLESFGFLLPRKEVKINYTDLNDENNIFQMSKEKVLKISFEKCLVLNSYFKEKYKPTEFKNLLKSVYSKNQIVSKKYSLNDLLKYATSFINTLKSDVITNGVSGMLNVGTLYAIHNRLGDSLSDWFFGADIIFSQNVFKTYEVIESHKYFKPVYEDALEVFKALYGDCVGTVDVNLRKELVMLGFNLEDVKNLKETLLPLYVFEDRGLSQKGIITLYYVTNTLRKFGIKEFGIGTEFIFAITVDEKDYRNANGLLNIPLWPIRAFVASWLMLDSSELRKEHSGLAVQCDRPLQEGVQKTLDAICISDFEGLRTVQFANDGKFYYKNILGITKTELEFANRFSVEYILTLLREKNLHQITKLKRRSITDKTERLI